MLSVKHHALFSALRLRVRLYYIGREVSAECLSNHAVFVQTSSHSNGVSLMTVEVELCPCAQC